MSVPSATITLYSANPFFFLLTLRVDRELTVGLASKQLFESLKTRNHLQAKIRRNRFSRRLETLNVTRGSLAWVEE